MSRLPVWAPPALYALASAFLMADANIAPAVLPALGQSFAIGEIGLGALGSLPLMLGALLGLASGHWADRQRRLPLLLAVLALGGLCALASGWPLLSPDFATFLAWRLAAGAAAGAMFPIAYSLVGDWVGPAHRGLTASLIDLVWGLGMMAGPALGTWALQTAGGWRAAHIATAVPGLLCAGLLALLVREPQREHSIDAAPTTAPVRALTLLGRRSNLLLVLQSLPGNLPWGLLPFWLIAYFQARHHLEPAQATLLWEALGIGAALGSVAWGAIGDRVWRRHPPRLPLLCAAVMLLGLAVMAALIHHPPAAGSMRVAAGVFAGVLISVVGPNVRAMLINTNAPRERGRVLGLFGLLDTLGRGAGPLLGGYIVTRQGGDLLAAMDAALLCWVIAALLLLCASKAMRR